MIPAGYMYKKVASRPDWLYTDQVQRICSVSACVSEDFDDWIRYWKHNGYWFFDSPGVIKTLAEENGVDLSGMKLFFYYVYEIQWNVDTKEWEEFEPEETFETDVVPPASTTLLGYDVTSFSAQNSAECSPLSCNRMAEEIKVTANCLLNSLEEAEFLLESGTFDQCEPGPYRVFEVHEVENAEEHPTFRRHL